MPEDAPPPPNRSRRWVLGAAGVGVGAAGGAGIAALVTRDDRSGSGSDSASGSPAERGGSAIEADAVRTAVHPVIDVTAHGAAGDGEADDTDALQSALDLAARTGATVFVPVGRYLVSATLRLASGVHVVGDSGIGGLPGDHADVGVSEIASDGFEGAVLENADTTRGDDGIALRRLRIVGAQGDAGSEFGAAVSIRAADGRCNGLTIEDCTVWRGGRAAVELENVLSSWVRNCFVGGNGAIAAGLLLRAVPDSHIVANQITTGCFRDGDGGPAVDLRRTDHTTFVANQVFFGDDGVRLEGSRCTISANRIDMNLRDGLVVHGSSSGNVVSGNVFHTNGRGGEALSPCAGVHLTDGAHHNVVTGNSFSDWVEWTPTEAEGPGGHQRHGVALTGTTHDNAISANVFVDQQAAPILTSSAGPNSVTANAGA